MYVLQYKNTILEKNCACFSRLSEAHAGRRKLGAGAAGALQGSGVRRRRRRQARRLQNRRRWGRG